MKLFLLDGATAELDNGSERLVEVVLNEAIKKCVCGNRYDRINGGACSPLHTSIQEID